MNTGESKLLLHRMRMWPQMIEEMFWTFSMKAIAERLNILQVDNKGRTPEYILREVNT